MKKAFTLVEVLLVMVIIAILAAIVIVAINPARQIAQANNTQRSSDVKSVLDAVYEYAIDNRGTIPAAITGTATVMGDDATTQIDLCALLVPVYITEMPFDPTATGAHYTSCTDYDTGYQISVATGRVTVSAPGAELSVVISITK